MMTWKDEIESGFKKLAREKQEYKVINSEGKCLLKGSLNECIERAQKAKVEVRIEPCYKD